MDPNLYDLMGGDDEPTAAARAQALSGEVGRDRAMAAIAQLAQGNVGGYANMLSGTADRREAALAEAPGVRLRRLLDKQRLAAGQAEMDSDNAPASSVYQDLAKKFGTTLPEGTTNRLAKEYLTMAERAYAAEQRAQELRLNRDASRGQREDAAAAKGEKDLDKQIETLSKRMESAPGLRNDIATLDRAAAADDIPGVGTGLGFVPSALISDEGIQNRQAIKGVLSTILKEESGVAVSPKELANKMEELGMGPNASEKQFKLGLERLKERTRVILRAKEAGARPEAVLEARRRGLVTSEDIPGAADEPPPPPEGGPPYQAPPGQKWQQSKVTGKYRLIDAGGG